MHVEIADGDRDASSQLVRNFEAGLFGVWSAQQSALIVPKSGNDKAVDHRSGRNPACSSENTCGELSHAGRRDRRASRFARSGRGWDRGAADDSRLNEQSPDRRHAGEYYIRVRQVARAAQLNDRDLLPDAGELAVVENP